MKDAGVPISLLYREVRYPIRVVTVDLLLPSCLSTKIPFFLFSFWLSGRGCFFSKRIFLKTLTKKKLTSAKMGYLKIRMPAQKKTSPKGDYTALELRRVGFSAKDLKQGAGGGGVKWCESWRFLW